MHIKIYIDEDTNGNLILKNILLDIISSNFDKSEINDNKNIIINESFINFIITNTKIQNNIAQPILNLGICEKILKTNFNIGDDEYLIIFLININKTNELLNKLVYEVYSKTEGSKLKKLDLNLYKDVIKIGENLLNNNIINCSNYSINGIISYSIVLCPPQKIFEFHKNR